MKILYVVDSSDPVTELKVWMLRNGISQSQVRRDLDVDPSVPSHYLSGKLVSRRIDDYFITKGCPRVLIDELRRVAKSCTARAANGD